MSEVEVIGRITVAAGIIHALEGLPEILLAPEYRRVLEIRAPLQVSILQSDSLNRELTEEFFQLTLKLVKNALGFAP